MQNLKKDPKIYLKIHRRIMMQCKIWWIRTQEENSIPQNKLTCRKRNMNIKIWWPVCKHIGINLQCRASFQMSILIRRILKRMKLGCCSTYRNKHCFSKNIGRKWNSLNLYWLQLLNAWKLISPQCSGWVNDLSTE